MTHSGIDPTTFSPTIRPEQDFYRYVHGPWLDSTQIPEDKTWYGAFIALRDQSEAHVRQIIEEAPTDSKIGALYASYMDEQAVEAAGTAPILADLAAIDVVQSPEELAALVGRLQREGIGGAINYGVYAGMDNPDANVLYLDQGGIGLPDEAFYREDQYEEIRVAYAAHIDRMAALTGAAMTGADVLALETEIASHHWDRVKTREADLIYNPRTLAGLEEESGDFPWRVWAAAIRMPEAAHAVLVAEEPDFFVALGKLWRERDLELWKQWLRWRVVNGRAAYMNAAIVAANFEFYGKTLNGQPEQRVRWKRAVSLVEGVLGEEVGKVYLARHFPPTHKAHMDALVSNLISAWDDSIKNIPWMSETTKEKALVKLSQFTPKIGYPDKWRDYSALEISATDLMANIRSTSAFEEDFGWSKIGKPVDRDEWHMTPQTVNAYYNPLANEIVFPAAILQPPFFDADADDAVNYGGICAVIGHEIGHGFDDQGSKFDGTGKLESWWTEEDRTEFERRAKVLIDQYDGYSPLQLGGEMSVNGALTIGENIGDLAGVVTAMRAYAIACGGSVDDAPVIDGLTGLQRFFIGYAQTEQELVRDEALKTRLATDPHSPAEFRINGILRNMDAWYEAFNVPEDAEMWLAPEERATIW
jgi:putative endopeptidase